MRLFAKNVKGGFKHKNFTKGKKYYKLEIK
jgi:hypothetical protein